MVSNKMALSRAANHQRRLQEAASVRVDAFDNFKPFFGDKQLDFIFDEAPPTEVYSLYVLCFRSVLRMRIPYEQYREQYAVPTVTRKKLDHFRSLVQWPGPRVMKCSKCCRYFTDREKFELHECHPRKGPVK